jgi:hypothetical protein
LTSRKPSAILVSKEKSTMAKKSLASKRAKKTCKHGFRKGSAKCLKRPRRRRGR